MKLRTFIAVAATPQIRKQALRMIGLLRPVADDVKWVASENLHWTLQFLGDVDEDDIPEVHGGIAEAVSGFDPFMLALRGVGAFPANDRPRTLWLGAGEGADEVGAIQGAVQQSLAQLGYRGESRRYVPHLTFGRAGRHTPLRELSTQLEALRDYEGAAMLVDAIGIYSSILEREGPRYELLGEVPLIG